MKQVFFKFIFSISCLVFVFFAFQVHAQTEEAPKILKIDGQEFSVSGTTPKGEEVLIYIDDKWVGMAEKEPLDDISENFSLTLKDFLSVGVHNIIAVAKDPTSLVLSPPSTEMIFETKTSLPSTLEVAEEEIFTEPPLPAPTLFQPVVNSQTSAKQPFIVGLAKNNSNIKVFINEELDGEFRVENHESGTANFAYLPSKPLTKNKYLVYTTTTDDYDRESRQSNIVSFTIKQPSIAQAAEEERQGAVSAIDEKTQSKINQPVVISEENGGVEEMEVEIIDGEQELAVSGAINENKIKQGKLRFDLAIFLLFFVGVLSWLFWVNRELIKEKRKHNQETTDKKKENNSQDKLL